LVCIDNVQIVQYVEYTKQLNERNTMNETTNISIRIDVQLKKQAKKLFSDLGLNMTTALTIFLRQAVRSQGIPFEISRVRIPIEILTAKVPQNNGL